MSERGEQQIVQYRSWLFVPADSEKKLARASSTGADVIILDLEDSVALQHKFIARPLATEWLRAHRTQITAGRPIGRWVRINALDTNLWRDDLIPVMAGAPDGIMLPKAAGPAAVQQLGAEIYELEQRNGVPTGSTRILPLVSETPLSALGITAYAEATAPRLAGLTWGAEDLSAAMGATRRTDEAGNWTQLDRCLPLHPRATAAHRPCPRGHGD